MKLKLWAVLAVAGIISLSSTVQAMGEERIFHYYEGFVTRESLQEALDYGWTVKIIRTDGTVIRTVRHGDDLSFIDDLDGIRVTIDGELVEFSGQGPVIVEGRTLIPVRGVFEALGFEVAWDTGTRTATFVNENHMVIITVGSYVFTTNGQAHSLDVPAQIIGGSTMLPIRAVLESVGLDVGWGDSTVVVSSVEYIRVASEPVWSRDPRFQNAALPQSGNESNGALADAIREFFTAHGREAMNTPGQHLTDALRESIRRGWIEDTFQTPFNDDFLQIILDSTYFNLVRGTGGLYQARELYSLLTIRVQASNSITDPFAIPIRTTLHEFSHALGLGENLAELFVHVHFGRHRPNYLSHNPVFVQELLRVMDEQNRANEFWNAAFYSTQAFAELWDTEMGHIVSYNDLWTAKMINYDLRQARASHVGHERQSEIRQTMRRHLEKVNASPFFMNFEEGASNQLMFDWSIMMGLPIWAPFNSPGVQDERVREEVIELMIRASFGNLTPADIAAATQRFNNLVRIYNDVAQELGIGTHAAVLEHAIRKQNRIIESVS